VVGALLVLLVFAFGRAVAGTPVGLCAAAFAAVQPNLIVWSGIAWMPSLFVLTFVGATYLLYLGYGHDRLSMQVAGAVGFVLALFVHELAVLLPMAVLATLAIRAVRGDFAWFNGRRSVMALSITGVGLVLFVALGLILRMGSVAGSTSEFQAYLTPSLTLAKLRFYYDRLLRGYPLLVAAAALGILFLFRPLKTGILFLYVTLGVGIVTLGFLLSKNMDRYGIMLLPLLAIVAGWSLAEGTGLVTGWFRTNSAVSRALPSVVLAAVFALSVQDDLRAAMRPEVSPARTWLSELQALGAAPDDLLFSDVPTIVAFYRGKVDYWARIQNYERYSYGSGNTIRELYTGAVMISSDKDFQRVVEANPGRTLWYLGKIQRFLSFKFVEPDLRNRLRLGANVFKISPDGWVILRIDLGGRQLGQR
jgi:hypothetical protein